MKETANQATALATPKQPGLLRELGQGQGYLKAGFLGFQGSGKTYTAAMLAIGLRQRLKLPGPIALIDTENASEYIAPMVRHLTGMPLVGERTRSFETLLDLAQECVTAGVSVLVVDSVTHFWRSICDSYLAGVNQTRAKFGKAPRMKLEFQDWSQVKGQWNKWADFYLNSALHIVICGRAGYEYDLERNEETGRNELIKTGIKMKTEAEFGFEPSLLVQMSLEQAPDGEGGFTQVRQAIVLKDRFGMIDGLTYNFSSRGKLGEQLEAVWAAFGPHAEQLVPGTHSTVSTAVRPLEVSEEGDVEWARERKARLILTEEIQGLLVSRFPGQSADEKRIKADLIQQFFGTRSWTAVENLDSPRLRDGFEKLRAHLEKIPRPPVPTVHEPASAPAPASPEPERQVEPKSSAGQEPSAAPPPAPKDGDRPGLKLEAEPVKRRGKAQASGPLSDETVAKIEQVIGEHGPEAVAWMVSQQWLKPDCGLETLDPQRATKIIANPRAFLTAIGVKRG